MIGGNAHKKNGVTVVVGDVVDLTEARLTAKGIEAFVMGDKGTNIMAIYAPEYAIHFPKGRVTRINEVRFFSKQNMNGAWRKRLAVFVDYENAVGEPATLKAMGKTSSFVLKVSRNDNGEITQPDEEERLRLPEYRS